MIAQEAASKTKLDSSPESPDDNVAAPAPNLSPAAAADAKKVEQFLHEYQQIVAGKVKKKKQKILKPTLCLIIYFLSTVDIILFDLTFHFVVSI